MAVYAMMFMGVMPMGALLAGRVAESVGVGRTVGAGGVICMLGAALFAVRYREDLMADSADRPTSAA